MNNYCTVLTYICDDSFSKLFVFYDLHTRIEILFYSRKNPNKGMSIDHCEIFINSVTQIALDLTNPAVVFLIFIPSTVAFQI